MYIETRDAFSVNSKVELDGCFPGEFGGTVAISDSSSLKAVGSLEKCSSRVELLRSEFCHHIPHRPYCTDDLKTGIRPRSREVALRKRFIQLNGPSAFEWLTFDYDKPGGYFADYDANLPPPNVIAINKTNGHAHLEYLLANPVARHCVARVEPLRYFSAVQRGFTTRLDADKQYVGLISKNPAHTDWLVEWRRDAPYTLDELDDWLFERDKRFDPRPETQFGAGRNVITFDELRTFAYREVLKFKRSGCRSESFRARMEAIAIGLNRQFPTPMSYSEVRAIAKSVSKWTWKTFSVESFSRIQSHRGKAGNAKRWAGHEADSKTKPWEALRISRRTYYRRKASEKSNVSLNISCMQRLT